MEGRDLAPGEPQEEQPVVSQPACPAAEPSPNDVALPAQLRINLARHPNLRLLTYEHQNGVVVLQGEVSTYHHKQLAQESARAVRGVEVIKNLVQVVPRGRKPEAP